jgi:hypothetical protein
LQRGAFNFPSRFADRPSKAVGKAEHIMILNGRLEDWTVDDLLQIMRITHKTGTLEITGEQRASIHFQEGAIGGIELGGIPCLSDQDRSVAVNVMAERLRTLLPLRSGGFEITDLARDGSNLVEVPDLLEAVQKLLDLERSALGDDVAENTALKLRLRLDPITLEPDTWLAVVDLVGTFSLERMVSRLGRSDAVQLLALLRRHDLFEHSDEAVEDHDDPRSPAEVEQPRRVGRVNMLRKTEQSEPSDGPTQLPEPLVGDVLRDIARLRQR